MKTFIFYSLYEIWMAEFKKKLSVCSYEIFILGLYCSNSNKKNLKKKYLLPLDPLKVNFKFEMTQK